MSATTLKTVLESPAPGCAPAPRPALTADQQTKYDWLLAQVQSWTDIVCPKAAGKSGPLTDRERIWLTRECLIRYLTAVKWHEREAEKRLLGTLAWRREFGIDELTPDFISPENETGKQVIVGFDKEARPCQYLIPGRQNTEPSHRQVEHLVFMVERVLELLPAGQETLCLLINFKQSKNRKYTAPGLGLAKECLHILQTHYPERLGRALIINVPWVVWGFFKLITPFIDPRTVDKLKFNEDMTQYVPEAQLLTDFEGGKLDFEYDHATYWPSLWEMCQKRMCERMQRWETAGKPIGMSEEELLGGRSVAAEDGKVVDAAAAAATMEKMQQEDTKVTSVVDVAPMATAATAQTA